MTRTSVLAKGCVVAVGLTWLGSVYGADAVAQSIADSQPSYDDCLTLAAEFPDRAIELALDWLEQGGGNSAAHCYASAQFNIGDYIEAALALEVLVEDAIELALWQRAQIAHQASIAWLTAEHPDRAVPLLDWAVEIAPNIAVYRLDRSEARIATDDLFGALDDLNHVLDRDQANAGALIFRASVYRKLDTPDLAWDDINRAIDLRPNHPAALLERGLLHAIDGNDMGAALDWNAIIAERPASPAAEMARANLAELAQARTQDQGQ